MKMRFMPDMPIQTPLADRLGLNNFVEVVYDSIPYTQPPFVYGILGDWGTGKSSALNLLENRLRQDFESGLAPLIPLRFNPWEYENETNILYPLLHCIRKDFHDRFQGQAAVSEFEQNFSAAVGAAVLGLTDLTLRIATKQLTGEALSLGDVSEQFKELDARNQNINRLLDEWVENVDILRTSFNALLDTYKKSVVARNTHDYLYEDLKFIILIDDLDRCAPDIAIAFLETLKIYLTGPSCVYVLALNQRVIYQGIRLKYQGLDIDGRAYLEKFLNYSFFVPDPAPNKVSEFILDSLEKLVVSSEDKLRYLDRFREFADTMSLSLFNNPRRIKRVLNRYLVFLSKYDDELDNYVNSNVAKLIVISEYFPSILRLLEQQTLPVIDALKSIGTDSFDIEGFEQEYGISLVPYGEVRRLRELFNLDIERVMKVSITEEIAAVLSIAPDL